MIATLSAVEELGIRAERGSGGEANFKNCVL